MNLNIDGKLLAQAVTEACRHSTANIATNTEPIETKPRSQKTKVMTTAAVSNAAVSIQHMMICHSCPVIAM